MTAFNLKGINNWRRYDHTCLATWLQSVSHCCKGSSVLQCDLPQLCKTPATPSTLLLPLTQWTPTQPSINGEQAFLGNWWSESSVRIYRIRVVSKRLSRIPNTIDTAPLSLQACGFSFVHRQAKLAKRGRHSTTTRAWALMKGLLHWTAKNAWEEDDHEKWLSLNGDRRRRFLETCFEESRWSKNRPGKEQEGGGEEGWHTYKRGDEDHVYRRDSEWRLANLRTNVLLPVDFGETKGFH